LLSHAGCPTARIYVVIYGLAVPAPPPVRGVKFASPQVDRVGQIVSESKFPPFVSCCRFLVLQIRVLSCPGYPISRQLEPID